MENNVDISKSIAKGLKEKDMSQKDLAERLDIGQSSIAKWVSGKAMPQADKMIEVINILELVEDFFPGYKKIDPGEEKEKASLIDRMAKQEEEMQLIKEKVAKMDKAVDMLLPLATKNNTAEELIDGIWDKLE